MFRLLSNLIFKNIRAYIVVLGVCLSIPTAAQAETHRIGVIVYDGVLTSDVTGPLEVFGAASRKAWFSDYKVETVSADPDLEITTEEGLTLVADHTLATAGDFDILIAASTYDMTSILKNKQLIAFVQRHIETADWLASNCSGAQILAKAGALDGYKATTWAGGERAFQRKFASVDVVENVNMVMDRNRLTSNGSLVSYEAALVLLAQLKSEQFANEISDYLQLPRLLNMDISRYHADGSLSE